MSKYLVLSLTVFLSGCYMDEESIVNNANINTHTRITADSITDDKNILPSLTDNSRKNADYVLWFEK